MESSEKGNTSEPPDSFLKALTVDHQGRLTEIRNLWINDFGHEIFQQAKKCVFAILMVNGALESGLKVGVMNLFFHS